MPKSGEISRDRDAEVFMFNLLPNMISVAVPTIREAFLPRLRECDCLGQYVPVRVMDHPQ